MANMLEKQQNQELVLKNAPQQSEEAMLVQAQNTAKANFDILSNTKTEQDKKSQEAQKAVDDVTNFSATSASFIEGAKAKAQEYVAVSSRYPKLLENIDTISEKQKADLLNELGYNILDKLYYGTEYEALEALLKKRIAKEVAIRAREMYEEELTKKENAAKTAQEAAKAALDKTMQVKAIYEADQKAALDLAAKIKENYSAKKLEEASKKAASSAKIVELGQTVARVLEINAGYENNPNYLDAQREAFYKSYKEGIEADLQKLGADTTTIGFMNDLTKKYTQLQGFSLAYLGSTDYQKIQGILGEEKNRVQNRLDNHAKIVEMKNNNMLEKQQADSEIAVEQKSIAQSEEMMALCEKKVALCDENISTARQRDNSPIMLAVNAPMMAGNVAPTATTTTPYFAANY